MDTQTNRINTVCRITITTIGIGLVVLLGLPQSAAAQCATEQIVFDFENGQLGDWDGLFTNVSTGYNSTYGVEIQADVGSYGKIELDEIEIHALFGSYPTILSLEAMYMTNAPSGILYVQPQFEYVNGSTSSQLYAESNSWTSLQLTGNGSTVGGINIAVGTSSGYGVGKFDNIVIEYCSIATPTPSTTPIATPTPYPTILPSSTPIPTFTPVATWLPNPSDGLELIGVLPTPWQVDPPTSYTLDFGTYDWGNIEYLISVTRGTLLLAKANYGYQLAIVFGMIFIAFNMLIPRGSRRYLKPITTSAWVDPPKSVEEQNNELRAELLKKLD